MTRVPTQRQYDMLRVLGAGGAILSWTEAQARPFARHGWVTDSEVRGVYRLSPDGLRALADAVDRYGWPPLAPHPVERPDPPRVVRLRQERDDARAQRDEAVRTARLQRRALERVRSAVNEFAALEAL